MRITPEQARDRFDADDMMAGIPVDLRDPKGRNGTKRVPTFTATIYVGLRVHYTGTLHSVGEIEDFLRSYCNEKGACVTVTPTKYIYTDGEEPGAAIGLINYPRFPSSVPALKSQALFIAEGLMVLLEQGKVSVVFPDETVMLESFPG